MLEALSGRGIPPLRPGRALARQKDAFDFIKRMIGQIFVDLRDDRSLDALRIMFAKVRQGAWRSNDDKPRKLSRFATLLQSLGELNGEPMFAYLMPIGLSQAGSSGCRALLCAAGAVGPQIGGTERFGIGENIDDGKIQSIRFAVVSQNKRFGAVRNRYPGSVS
jgi:hypothetical protein